MLRLPLPPHRARFLISLPRWDELALEPWPQVALAGRSNVGKSSLLNALLGRRSLARTSSTPGRTQALNFFLVEECLLLVDLPGYGYARAPVGQVRRWTENTRGYLADATCLRAVVLLLDIRRDPSAADRDFAGLVRGSGRPLVAALTKCDKVGRGQWAGRSAAIAKALELPAGDPVLTSAKTGQGREALWRRMLELVAAAEVEGCPVARARTTLNRG